MTATRTRALDAAVELLGTGGLRALTHARVDEHANLPKGSTSNHFRTRAALLAGVVDWIAAHELRDMGGSAHVPTTPAELVDVICAFLDHLTGPDRTWTAARLVVFLEAGHEPGLRDALSRVRAVMEESVVAVLTELGAPDPLTAAQAIAACCEGVILHRVARNDHTDPRPLLELVVRGAFPREETR
ncbi:TetR family transcriptional regulator [Saccharothrix mutabilis subsp. mutabilis]|uniref:TetR family transcriptional regulator n=1 Tax=Saccharothrix mutabilis subsp. mutabilis TaxID=66855 RepID=A0ABN0T3C0_9PSEU